MKVKENFIGPLIIPSLYMCVQSIKLFIACYNLYRLSLFNLISRWFLVKLMLHKAYRLIVSLETRKQTNKQKLLYHVIPSGNMVTFYEVIDNIRSITPEKC